jgi:hypothetical protein
MFLKEPRFKLVSHSKTIMAAAFPGFRIPAASPPASTHKKSMPNSQDIQM